MNLFLRGGVDAASAMWYNEYHMLLNSGLDEDEIVSFPFRDHGLNFPEDGIYCLEETLVKNRDLVCRFVKASLEGWQYAFAHKDEAIDIVMMYAEKANTGTNRIHQKWMLDRINDLMKDNNKRLSSGQLTREGYDIVSTELKNRGIISTIPPFDEFHVHCGNN